MKKGKQEVRDLRDTQLVRTALKRTNKSQSANKHSRGLTVNVRKLVTQEV